MVCVLGGVLLELARGVSEHINNSSSIGSDEFCIAANNGDLFRTNENLVAVEEYAPFKRALAEQPRLLPLALAVAVDLLLPFLESSLECLAIVPANHLSQSCWWRYIVVMLLVGKRSASLWALSSGWVTVKNLFEFPPNDLDDFLLALVRLALANFVVFPTASSSSQHEREIMLILRPSSVAVDSWLTLGQLATYN